MKTLKTMLTLAMGLVFVAPAFAETQNVKVSGSLDAYAFYRNAYDLNNGNDAGAANIATGTQANNHTGSLVHRSEGDSYFMSITQLRVDAALTNNVSTVINLINQRDWNADVFDVAGGTGAANNTTQEFDVMIDLAYVQMKEIFYAPLTLTVGRQDLTYGRGFVVGWNPQDPSGTIQADEFTQIQSFDAIRATLDFSPWTIDIAYSKIVENAHDPEDDRDLWVNYVTYKFSEYNAVAEAYFIADLDRASNATNVLQSNDLLNSTYTLGGRVQFDPISQMTLGAELAHQMGEYAAAVTAGSRNRDAWGADIFGEYRFDNVWKPMVGLQYVYLSGEGNQNASTTNDYQAWNGFFRSPTYGWIRDYQEITYDTADGLNQPAGQNQQHVSLYGTLKPMEDLTLWGAYYHFWNDEEVHTTPANNTTSFLSDDLGDEIDTQITYAYTEDVTFSFMANWFIPGDFYNDPNNDTASEYVSRVTVTF